MEKYIATKPVRLDRDYFIGEEIPAGAINRSMLKRLIGWGKIQQVTVPDSGDPAPSPTNLTGGSLEASVEDMEKLLGINHGEAPPDLETRAAFCLEKLHEIGREKLSPTDYQLPASPEETGGETPSADAAETPRVEPQGGGDTNTLPGTENTQDDTADGTGEAPEPKQEANRQEEPQEAEPTEFICQVCGKKCASKSGLASHMKTHDKD